MHIDRIISLKEHWEHALFEDVVPFWETHGLDTRYGGMLTYLDRDGTLAGTDKPVWIQSRVAWLFARLFRKFEARDSWMDEAQQIMRFVDTYCFDRETGKMFFLVTREGKPLRLRRYFASETFYLMAAGELYLATGESRYKDSLLTVYDRSERLIQSGRFPEKWDPDVRPFIRHGAYMSKIGLFLVLREAGDLREWCDDEIEKAIEALFTYFVKPEARFLYEITQPDGTVINTPEGRTINPGHAIESCWFMLEYARRKNDTQLISRVLPVLDWHLERGWDREHGGFFYFLDAGGHSSHQLEWDMKLWWPHNEALYATLLAYHLTGDEKYAAHFEKVFAYTEEHFPDTQYGEWYGYLHRDGSTAVDLKGNLWKGPFHLPRQQIYCLGLLDEMGAGPAGDNAN